MRVPDQSDSSSHSARFVPPSGHIAGIYARNDFLHGIHKSPANEEIRGVLDLEVFIRNGEQLSLNSNGINVLRAIPSRGIRVWGNRTLSSDVAWRYIHIRRVLNFVIASIKIGTEWVLFEPQTPVNPRKLWQQIKDDISDLLTPLWRGGAFVGERVEEAFIIKCDEELNPPEIRDLGMVIVDIHFSLENETNKALRIVYKR